MFCGGGTFSKWYPFSPPWYPYFAEKPDTRHSADDKSNPRSELVLHVETTFSSIWPCRPRWVTPHPSSSLCSPFPVRHLPTAGRIYEAKCDGYIGPFTSKIGRGVRLVSRNRKSFNHNYRRLIDGEIVALDAQEGPSFQLLQGYAKDPTKRSQERGKQCDP